MKRSTSCELSRIWAECSKEFGFSKLQNRQKAEAVIHESIPSGFAELDKITGEWQPGNLVIIAARPSMGKTAFALSMARNMALDYGYGVALFSLEMSAHQLLKRMIYSETELDGNKIRTGKLETHEQELFEAKVGKLIEAPIFIDDTSAISVIEFREQCSKLVYKHNIRVAFIDYVQLMNWTDNNKGNREQEVSNIVRSLKAFAKELNITIIALSQLNRMVENRGGIQGKRPYLADIRDAPNAIEQDADIVVFIHRAEYFGFTEDADGNSLEGVAEIIVAKNRYGALGDVQLTFDKNCAKFTE